MSGRVECQDFREQCMQSAERVQCKAICDVQCMQWKANSAVQCCSFIYDILCNEVIHFVSLINELDILLYTSVARTLSVLSVSVAHTIGVLSVSVARTIGVLSVSSDTLFRVYHSDTIGTRCFVAMPVTSCIEDTCSNLSLYI